MATVNLTIGERLKSIRQKRNMTLEDVAGLTGVSKPMLGQIERGQSSPTVTTLWKIATGLKVPFSVFLQEQGVDYSVASVEAEQAVCEEGGAMRLYPLFVFDPARAFEVFYIEFDPGCVHGSQRHDDGVEEYIFVVHGTLHMTLGGEGITLGEKQAIRFRADIPHSYGNHSGEVCCIYNTIFYRADR